jgi:uncharacterized protein (UPF0128 family)
MIVQYKLLDVQGDGGANQTYTYYMKLETGQAYIGSYLARNVTDINIIKSEIQSKIISEIQEKEKIVITSSNLREF